MSRQPRGHSNAVAGPWPTSITWTVMVGPVVCGLAISEDEHEDRQSSPPSRRIQLGRMRWKKDFATTAHRFQETQVDVIKVDCRTSYCEITAQGVVETAAQFADTIAAVTSEPWSDFSGSQTSHTEEPNRILHRRHRQPTAACHGVTRRSSRRGRARLHGIGKPEAGAASRG
jgi:hypothetical protein